MAKSVRQQRLKAVDDLRDMADAMEEAADIFEEILGDLERVTPEGGVKSSGKNMPYEEMKTRLGIYQLLMPSKLRTAVEAHLAGPHEQEDCPVCLGQSGEGGRGWLRTVWHQFLRGALAEAIRDGEIDEEVRFAIRNELMDQLVERGLDAAYLRGLNSAPQSSRVEA